MAYTSYSIVPSDLTVTLDGTLTAQGVSMVGIPATVQAVQWDGVRDLGTIEYKVNPVTGELPPPSSFTDPDDYSVQVSEAEAIIDAYLNPVDYYFTQEQVFEGGLYLIGQKYTSIVVGHPAPPDTTLLVPPSVPTGQTLYWYNEAWVVSSFDPRLALPQAKSSLISTVTQDGASAVNGELGLYSNVQQITAGDVLTLDCVNFPGSTIGDYQTFVDGVIASETAYINAQTSTENLYSYNPQYVTFDPSTRTYSGTLQSNRGGNDMNPSWLTAFTCSDSTITASELVIYVPSSDTTLPYLPSQDPPGWDSFGSVFVGGDYTIQLKYGPLVIASFILNNRSNQAWTFSYPPATTYTQVSGGGSAVAK
jgi:hypothetical protein